MSGSCEKCWDHICSCGWKYKHLGVQELEDLIAVLQDLIEKKVRGVTDDH